MVVRSDEHVPVCCYGGTGNNLKMETGVITCLQYRGLSVLAHVVHAEIHPYCSILINKKQNMTYKSKGVPRNIMFGTLWFGFSFGLRYLIHSFT